MDLGRNGLPKEKLKFAIGVEMVDVVTAWVGEGLGVIGQDLDQIVPVNPACPICTQKKEIDKMDIQFVVWTLVGVDMYSSEI